MDSTSIANKIKLAANYHQQGRLQDAEVCYREILKIEKNNPIANHNLGMIALQFGKNEVARSLFKVALENNIGQVQFWVSYIESLLYSGLYHEAKIIYAQGVSRGINGESYSLLGERIKTPKPELVTELIKLYENEKYVAAESCANALINKYPHYGLAWKVLGACLSKIGKEELAIKAKYVAASLMPTDAEAHYNLGNSLLNEKRYAEAANSFNTSLRLQPNNAIILNKLGLCMQNIGQLDLAKKYYSQCIKIEPKNAEAHKNIGNIYMQTRDYRNAQINYIASIKLNNQYADGYNNLGAAYFAQGEIYSAKDAYEMAVALDASASGYLHNLGMANYFAGNLEKAHLYFKKNINNTNDPWVLESAVYLIVMYYLQGELEACLKLINSFSEQNAFKSVKVYSYFPYVKSLIQSKINENRSDDESSKDHRKIYVVGESHSLTANELKIEFEDKTYNSASKWIIGCKQWHLANDKFNQYKFAFESTINQIPQGSLILLTIGEIDCRPDEGVLKALKKTVGQSIERHVRDLVHSYVEYVLDVVKTKKQRIILGGVPATNIPLEKLHPEIAKKLLKVIIEMNLAIKNEAILNGLGFLDVYTLTDRGDGISTGQWHIDDVHLKPNAINEAFVRIKIMPKM